jgi:hypothetical protein
MVALGTVQAAVAVVVALIATWTGLLITVSLAMPKQTGMAEYALETAPRRCFLSGLGMLLLLLSSFRFLQAPLPGMKLVGILLLLALGAVLTLGAAGLAQLLGRRIGEMSGARTSFGTLVRGSLVYSLAMGFPLIGWYLFLPLSAVCALGAGAVALWSRRRPAPLTPSPVAEQQGAM